MRVQLVTANPNNNEFSFS